MTAHKNTLVLGGARSGKSRFALEMAQDLARSASKRPGMLATAQAFDSEMEERIARHKAERGPEWLNAEEPLDIAAALASFPADCGAIVVDCLTLWLSNIMHHDRGIEAETAVLITALEQAQTPILLVSNEVGLGLVPETPLGRAFRDAQGRLNQQMAQVCGTAIFMAAGLPLYLKGPATP